MSNITSIDTALSRRIEVTMRENGSGYIALRDTSYGDVVQAALSKDEVDKLREALSVSAAEPTPSPGFFEGQRLVVTGTNGHNFDIGDIVKIERHGSKTVYRAVRVRDGYAQYISERDLKKVSATTPKFSVGDTVVVTGDSNKTYRHNFAVGTKVRIEDPRDSDGDYWVENDETGSQAYLFEGDMKAAPKFSEGDKVRVIGNTEIRHHYEIGDIVSVRTDGYGGVIECSKPRPEGRPLCQGVSVRDLELFTGPELVEGDIYLDEDLDPWTVRAGKLAFHDRSHSQETWDWVEEAYGPLKKIAGWHVVLPNGEKVKGLSTAGPELFNSKEGAERLAENRTKTLKDLGAVVSTPARVEPVFA